MTDICIVQKKKNKNIKLYEQWWLLQWLYLNESGFKKTYKNAQNSVTLHYLQESQLAEKFKIIAKTSKETGQYSLQLMYYLRAVFLIIILYIMK